MPESQLEAYYSSLTDQQKKALILIEDAEEEGQLLITYGRDMSTEEIQITHLGLYASNWKKGDVVRIDSWRFKCLQHSFNESDVIKDIKKSFRKLILWFKDDKKVDLLDSELDHVMDLIRGLDDEVLGLFTINNEQHEELISLDGKCSQGDESFRGLQLLNGTSTLKIQEPTLTVNSEQQ